MLECRPALGPPCGGAALQCAGDRACCSWSERRRAGTRASVQRSDKEPAGDERAEGRRRYAMRAEVSGAVPARSRASTRRPFSVRRVESP